MNMTLGDWILAMANSVFISFSDSPIHLDTSELAEIEKKVHLHSVATAFASMVLPFPGGPYNRIPESGDLMPENRSGFS